MNADDKSIEELLRMAEHVANTGSTKDDQGVTGRRVANSEARRLISEGYTDIWPIWHRIVALRDEALAYSIGQVWVPAALLNGEDDTGEVLDEDGRFKCVLSSRVWFDEDKLMPDDTRTIYSAIEIVVGLSRAVGPLITRLLGQTGEDDDTDPE